MEISEDNYAILRDVCQYLHPIPVDEEGNPKYSPAEWTKFFIKNVLIDFVKKGRKRQKMSSIKDTPNDFITIN